MASAIRNRLLLGCVCMAIGAVSGCRTDSQQTEAERKVAADKATSSTDVATLARSEELRGQLPDTKEDKKARIKDDSDYREEHFKPLVTWRRDFLVFANDQIVGKAQIEVQEWHHGQTLVTHQSSWLFPDASATSGYRRFAEVRHSESGGRSIRWWGNIREEGFTHRFEVKPTGHYCDVTWHPNVKNSAKRVPTTSRLMLFQSLRKRLFGQLRVAGSTLRTEVIDWVPEKPGKLIWEFKRVGDVTLSIEGGGELPTAHLVISSAPGGNGLIEVWVDAKGYPVQWTMPMLGLKAVATAKLLNPEEIVGLSWQEAQKQFDFKADRSAFENLAWRVRRGVGAGKASKTDAPADGRLCPDALLLSYFP